ncbi:MAG TPA: ABC transporter substrate-binding protein [Methylomirabilota bacterium]
MDRRHFVTGLGCLLASPRAGEAQQRQAYRVAFLTLNPRSGTPATLLDVLRQGFKELGYHEGENLVLEYRFADGNRDLLQTLTLELLKLQPAVIVTFGTPATVVAKNAAPTLPVVFIGVGDPVGSGFAESLARPRGRLTGFSFVGPELAAKNLEFLKLAVPEASNIAVLAPGDPDQPLGRAVWSSLEQSARVLHVSLQRFQIQGTVEQLDRAFGAMVARRPDALLILNDPLFFVHRTRILSAADRLRLPTMFQAKQYAVDGALLAYAPDYADQGKRAARYVDRILKGANPGDLPVEQPTKFELVINVKTARAFGLTIPSSLLLRADQVIE